MSEAATHWEGEPVRVWESLWAIPSLHVFDALPSTSAWLRSREGELPDFTTAIAETQSAGRGRNGDPWLSPPGGLWMSWSCRPRTPGAIPLVPIRTGLAVARAVRRLHDLSVGIKWPNDLWIGDRKLGGILCEAVRGGVVVGVGLNVADAPECADCRTPPIALAEATGSTVSRSALAGAILREAREALDRGGVVLRPDEVEELAGLDVLRGRDVRVRPGPTGTAAGIDESGRLGVRTESGTTRVSSGTIELTHPHTR